MNSINLVNAIKLLKKTATKVEPQGLQKKAPGFSFLELIFVIGIIATLTATLGYTLNSYLKKSSIGTAKASLRRLSTAIDFYYNDTDKYPTTLNDLLVRPTDVKNWEGYLDNKKELIDPWKNKYQYAPTPDGGEHPYELFSYGPGKKGSKADRISVWDAK